MKNKTQLSVRPVRKSKKPGYPSWQEPNPLEQPYAQPYPFTQKAINWLAAGGLCGALFLMPEAEGKTVLPKTGQAHVENDTIKHPFDWNKMGLPYYTPMYGTGSAERLNEKEAKAVIEGVFRRVGFNLEKATVKTSNGTVEATGFDEKMRMGYVWLGYENTDLDLMLNPNFILDNFEGEKLITYILSIETRLSNMASIKKQYDYNIYWGNNKTDAQNAFNERLKAMIDKGEPDWKEEYRWMFYEHYLSGILASANNNHLPPQIKRFIAHTLSMEDGEKRHNRLKSAYFIASTNYFMNQKGVSSALVKAAKSKTPRLNISRIITIWFAMTMIQKDAQNQLDWAKLNTALNKGEAAWKKGAALAMQRWDERKVCKDEIMELLRSIGNDAYSILPISDHDESLIYNTTDAELQKEATNYKASLRKHYAYCDQLSKDTMLQNKEKVAWERCQSSGFYPDSTDMDNMVKKIWEINGTTKEQALRTLEKNVLDYIQWAKQQRGY